MSPRAIFFLNILLFTLLTPGCNRGPITPPGMLLIPGGEFILGVDLIQSLDFVKESGARQGLVYDDSHPARKIFVGKFYLDKYEVTNREYMVFCEATGHPVPAIWKKQVFPDGEENYPVSGITWSSAQRFCRWSGKRLPSEEEWEKAARGFEGNIFPWGNTFQGEMANIASGELLEVGTKKGDKSVFGIFDMAGNVMEWTESWYEPYPGSKKKSEDFGQKFKVVRGGEGLSRGHYSKIETGLRSYIRLHVSPNAFGKDLGFRCAKDFFPQAAPSSSG